MRSHGMVKLGTWEYGVAAANVQLIDASGAVVTTTTTAASGAYSFSDVPPGDYRVKFFSPVGAEFVRKNAGAPDKNSYSNANGTTSLIKVAAGAAVRNFDAAIARPPIVDAADDRLVMLQTEAPRCRTSTFSPMTSAISGSPVRF